MDGGSYAQFIYKPGADSRCGRPAMANQTAYASLSVCRSIGSTWQFSYPEGEAYRSLSFLIAGAGLYEWAYFAFWKLCVCEPKNALASPLEFRERWERATR